MSCTSPESCTHLLAKHPQFFKKKRGKGPASLSRNNNNNKSKKVETRTRECSQDVRLVDLERFLLLLEVAHHGVREVTHA